MDLPFTREQFFGVFEAYNDALWPFALALWLVSLATLVLCLRTPHRAPRSLSILLVIHWVWAALAYHMAFFSVINPAAWLFAALFLFQAGLFTYYGFAQKLVTPSAGQSPRHIVSWALVAYAMAYPVIAVLEGHRFPRLPTFGIPCPATLLTIGLLMMSDPPLPKAITIIPILWGLIGGSAAFLLGVHTDVLLLAASAGLLLHNLR